MKTPLMEALSPKLLQVLGRFGFQAVDVKIGAKARSFMSVKGMGLALDRPSSHGSHEFLYFQPGSDRFSVTAFAGWDPSRGRIPNPQNAFDFPDVQHSEFSRSSFVFPVFTLFDSSGTRLNAKRLEGDEWLLVGAGLMPDGVSDGVLAQGVAAQLAARLACSAAWNSGDQSAAVSALARRIVEDLSTTVLPYLPARVQQSAHRL